MTALMRSAHNCEATLQGSDTQPPATVSEGRPTPTPLRADAGRSTLGPHALPTSKRAVYAVGLRRQRFVEARHLEDQRRGSCPPRVHDREGQQAWAQKQNLQTYVSMLGACRSSEDGDTTILGLCLGGQPALKVDHSAI
jgi:hypothetical protein